MNKDLERLIALQRLDSAVADAERRLAEEPETQRVFDARLEHARQQVATAKNHLTDNQNARREVEKEVAVHQGRLSKFRDQLMSVKTNIEYQAMQKEIEYAQKEVKVLEERILERMLEADDLTSAVKRTDAALAAEQKVIEGERRTLAAELAKLKESLDHLRKERTEIVAAINPQVLAVFNGVSKKRNGVAMAQAREGICTICHVRLRPQIFNTILKNEEILQCDSCQRILYYIAPVRPASPDTASPQGPAVQPAS